jgi:hypothetical protein
MLPLVLLLVSLLCVTPLVTDIDCDAAVVVSGIGVGCGVAVYAHVCLGEVYHTTQ